jgi:hypothetical protein
MIAGQSSCWSRYWVAGLSLPFSTWIHISTDLLRLLSVSQEFQPEDRKQASHPRFQTTCHAFMTKRLPYITWSSTALSEGWLASDTLRYCLPFRMHVTQVGLYVAGRDEHAQPRTMIHLDQLLYDKRSVVMQKIYYCIFKSRRFLEKVWIKLDLLDQSRAAQTTSFSSYHRGASLNSFHREQNSCKIAWCTYVLRLEKNWGAMLPLETLQGIRTSSTSKLSLDTV